MEIKKTEKANLEGKKIVFTEIGLVFALAVLLFAFEWRTDSAEKAGFNIEVAIDDIEEDIIPITQQLMKPPPPPPPPKRIIDIIDIVDDDIELDDNLEILDAEDESLNEVPTEYDYDGDYDGDYDYDEEIFTIVESMPQFPHGDVVVWLRKNTKYPPIAEQNGIQGRVYVKFVIEKDGSVTNVEVTRSVDPLLDKEALRVVNSMPKWKPGKQRDKAVRVSYTVPITFALQ